MYVLAGIAAVFLLFLGRLFYLMVIQGEELQQMALSQWTRDTSMTAGRGLILDTNGVVLAQSGTAYKVFKDYPINICAKTGTADAGVNDVNAAFICYAPAEDPQIVIAIYGENAGHGSAVADIAKSILDAYFEIGESGDVDSSENQVS